MKKLLLLAIILIASNSFADTIAFKNFKQYPKGQWQVESNAYQNGVAMGPIQSDSACFSPIDDSTKKLLQNLKQDCQRNLITDTPSKVEIEQICQGQTTHITMNAINNNTMTVETTNSARANMIFKTKMTYQGTCTASTQKLSAEECAQLPEMRQGIVEGENSCATVPESYKSRCMSQVAIGKKMLEVVEQKCK